MADRSENPQDNAELRKVKDDLRGIKDDLSAELRKAQDLTASAEADKQRAQKDRTTAKKSAESRATRSPNPVGAADEGIPSDKIREQSRALEENRRLKVTSQRASRDAAKSALEEAAAKVRLAQAEQYLSRVQLPAQVRREATGAAPGGAVSNVERVVRAQEEQNRLVEEGRKAQEQARLEAERVKPFQPQQLTGAQAAQANAKPFTPQRITPQSLKAAADAGFRLAESQDAQLQRAIRLTPALQEYNGALQEQTRALGLADNAYTRHGYLTSEFISAAARGEVTFQELGSQVTGTIAKFAGWTAAATSVYAVVGAMGALYRGAIQSASGVELVNRVVSPGGALPGGSDQLQQSFRDLERKFNLPTEDVTQAVYGAAKATGGDLPDALKAAESALFGVKVGELSAADSTRYLQAIMRGFGAQAGELPAIFDAINQAQNRFGGSTGDMIAGVAKAAGTFRLAGGNYRQLIALITAGTKLTGAAGGEVATAISRSASRSLTPQGAEALRKAGLDPEQEYPALLAEAMGKAKKANYDPKVVDQLSRALVPSGGQFTRIFNPLLSNQKLYQDVYKELDPNKAQGSATRELAKALKQPDEQLKRLIVDLERLGSTLAQAGGLDLLVGLVKGLDTALDLTVRLVDAFNSLTPGPLRHIITPLLELSLILKGLRRFDVGASLPAGQGGGAYDRFREGLRRDPAKRADAEIRLGIGDEKRFLEQERRTAALGASRATYQTERAAVRRDEAQSHFQSLPYGPDREKAGERLKALDSLYLQRQVESERLVADQLDYVERNATVQKQITDYERYKKEGLTAEAAALKSGIYYAPPTLNRPVAESPQLIRGRQAGAYGPGPDQLVLPGVGGAPGAPKPPKPPTIETPEQASRRMWAERQAAARNVIGLPPTGAARAQVTGAAAVAAQQAALAFAAARASKAGEIVEGVAKTGAGAIKQVGSGMAAGISGLRALGTTTLGAIDGAFVAIPAALVVWGKIQQELKSNEQQLAQLRDTGGGPEGIETRLRKYREDSTYKSGDVFRRPGHTFAQGIKGLSSDFSKIGNALIPGGSPLFDQKAEEEQAAKEAESYAKNLREAQKKGALLFVPQIQANFKRGLATAQTPEEITAALDKGLAQIRAGYANTLGDKNAQAVAERVKADFIEKTTALAAARGSLDDAAKHVTDLAGLKGFAAGVQTSFGLTGTNATNLGGAGFAIGFAREQIGRDPTKAADALAQINTVEGQVTQAVNDRMARLLSVAKSPREQGAIRGQAIADLRTGLTSGLQSRADALGASIAATEDAITRTQAEIASGKGGKGAQARLGGLQSRLTGRKNRYAQVTEGLRRENETVDQFQAEQDKAQFQAEQSLFDAQTTRRAAGIRDPVEALRFQLRRQRSRLDEVAKQYGKQSVEYEQALAQERQTQDQIVQAEISRIQTAAQVKAAQTTNPVIAARITLDGTNRALADLARRGRQQTEQYQQLLIQKAQQQQQLVQAQIQSFQGTQQLNRARSNVGASPGAQVQGALTDAQNFAAYIGSLGAQATPDQITGAATAVAQAQGAMADYVRQQAQAMVTAQGELAKSKTTDPVAQARIDLRTAQQNVKFAQSPAERVSALAVVNNAKRNTHDVKLQAAEDDIAFQREMEQISVSTAIARYRGLLKDKELSKAQKQDILRKIKGLENDKSGDSSFNIDPSSIRLPTPYEVFRAIKEGTNATQRANLRGAVQNTNHISITVADQSDVQKVADVFDQFLDTSAASSLRAMGVA